jgi:hypothetical protein
MKLMKSSKLSAKISHIFSGRLNIIRACSSRINSTPDRINVLCDQFLDSIIVGSITGVSAYIYGGGDVSLKAAGLSFLLTFLIKMKEYRKIT